MFKAVLILVFATIILEASAAVREIYIPKLDCQDHYFQDVSVNFDDEKTTKEELTISLICQRLRSKVVKRAVVSDLSRFIIDKMAPQQVEKFGPRANDFFKMVIFKPSIIGKTKFDYTEEQIEDVVERLKNPKYMRLRSFSPAPENMHVLAYQSEGAAYLNRYKTERHACSMINTLVHEYMHFIGYSHGDNDATGKENSVPYFFGQRAEELCEAGVI